MKTSPAQAQSHNHSSNTSCAVKPKDEYCVPRMCCVEPQLWPRPGAAVHCFEVTANYKLNADSMQVCFGLSYSNMHERGSASMGQQLKSGV